MECFKLRPRLVSRPHAASINMGPTATPRLEPGDGLSDNIWKGVEFVPKDQIVTALFAWVLFSHERIEHFMWPASPFF